MIKKVNKIKYHVLSDRYFSLVLLLVIFRRASKGNGRGVKNANLMHGQKMLCQKYQGTALTAKKGVSGQKRGKGGPVAPLRLLCHCLSIFSGLVFQPVTANATDDVCEFVYCNCLHCKRGSAGGWDTNTIH